MRVGVKFFIYVSCGVQNKKAKFGQKRTLPETSLRTAVLYGFLSDTNAAPYHIALQ